MRNLILALLLVSFAGTAYAADDTTDKKPAGAAKGAAVGGLAGHEIGSGHAVAGAAVGAAAGHHQAKKAEESKGTKQQ
jgi:outer membrane lipoprotein SlyB